MPLLKLAEHYFYILSRFFRVDSFFRPFRFALCHSSLYQKVKFVDIKVIPEPPPIQTPVTEVEIRMGNAEFYEEKKAIVFTAVADGTDPQFIWDFGDGNSGNGASVSHTYTFPNDKYSVTVIASNDVTTKLIRSDPIIIEVLAEEITELSAEVSQQPVKNKSVLFTAKVETGRDPQYSWTFGDGSGVHDRGRDPTISKKFDRSGFFEVTLTAENNRRINSSKTIRRRIEVLPPRVKINSLTKSVPQSPSAPVTVYVQDEDSEGTIYYWNWGDGSKTITSTIPLDSHSYAKEKLYPVIVRAENRGGSSTKAIVVSNRSKEDQTLGICLSASTVSK
ncbi:PKD domain-containing protein [Chloroflexi bacterium TSY]|nr:PKD domain-containing protein [Chloroflexi bacterium TSY]